MREKASQVGLAWESPQILSKPSFVPILSSVELFGLSSATLFFLSLSLSFYLSFCLSTLTFTFTLTSTFTFNASSSTFVYPLLYSSPAAAFFPQQSDPANHSLASFLAFSNCQARRFFSELNRATFWATRIESRDMKWNEMLIITITNIVVVVVTSVGEWRRESSGGQSKI